MRSVHLHFQFFMIYSGTIMECKCANSVVNTEYEIRNTQIKNEWERKILVVISKLKRQADLCSHYSCIFIPMNSNYQNSEGKTYPQIVNEILGSVDTHQNFCLQCFLIHLNKTFDLGAGFVFLRKV